MDLRTHLQAPPSAPEGIDLLALCQKLLTNAIRPVLKEVNITGALGHIAGAFFSSGSSRGQSTLDVIPTPDVVAQETLKGMKEAQKSMKRGVDNAAGCCLLAKDSCLRNCLHAGADKYCNTDDNQILLRSSICEGLLDKRVKRYRGECCACGGWSRPVLEHVRLKKGYGGLVLYYTKTSASGNKGATKKIRLRKVRYDRDALSCLLEDERGRKRKEAMFRMPAISDVATEDKRLPLKDWWAAIAPGVEPSQNWVELRVSAAGDDVSESSEDESAPSSPVARKKSVRFEEEW